MHFLAMIGLITGLILIPLSDRHERWDAVCLAFISLIVFVLTF